MEIGMEIIASSLLKAIGYDEGTEIVSVQFKNGDVWHYKGVPLSVYDFVRNSPSVGHAFIQHIRDSYESERQ